MSEGFSFVHQVILNTGFVNIEVGHVVMWLISFLFIFLAIKKGFEPLLLLPIGFGILLANLPLAPIMGFSQMGSETHRNLLQWFYDFGVANEIIPCLIFMGIGAMTDFGPMIANPKTLLLGAAAQLGVYVAMFVAIFLGFNLKEAASIGIIGGADGPTCIYLTVFLAPHLLGANALAAYSYMAMVPIIQPPIMKLLTTEAERKIRMKQLRKVSKLEKVIFPLLGTIVICLLIPPAAPLMGMMFVGNLFRESGVVQRLSQTAQNELINIVTILLGLTVGPPINAGKFLQPQPNCIFSLGIVAFAFSTAGGVLMAKIMNLFLKEKINPLIGSAGVSAVPMAARVSHLEGLKADKHNHLLMHAMGPN
ncbi:MAG: sodium ion-translocating decarboxylase subunit beta, partial [Syntrophales bacterium]|nr:sodium ion-translocating decarboxylase subunit beta [Syntrophales bacterium]